MNYRYLLKQYIKSIIDHEGLSYAGLYSKSDFFNDKERQEMLEIELEAGLELKIEKNKYRKGKE